MQNEYEQGVAAFKQYRAHSVSDSQDDYLLVSSIYAALEYEHGRYLEASRKQPFKAVVLLSITVISALVISLLYVMCKYHIS